MEQFITAKILHLQGEQTQLDALLAASDDLMVSGLIQQEMTRNEGLIRIYRAILAQYGWVSVDAAE